MSYDKQKAREKSSAQAFVELKSFSTSYSIIRSIDNEKSKYLNPVGIKYSIDLRDLGWKYTLPYARYLDSKVEYFFSENNGQVNIHLLDPGFSASEIDFIKYVYDKQFDDELDIISGEVIITEKEGTLKSTRATNMFRCRRSVKKDRCNWKRELFVLSTGILEKTHNSHLNHANQ